MKRRVVSMLTLLVVLVTMTGPVFADVGPKPSVRIRFKNMEEGTVFYGTLLSEHRSTGPCSAFDPLHGKRMSQDNREISGPEAEALWQAFQDYAEEDDFYFLQSWYSCWETGQLNWTYHPPEPFKLLLYFPETNTFRCSPVYERYAFHGNYTVDLSEEELVLERDYQVGRELVSFLARVVLTLAVELAAALMFGYRSRKQLRFLVKVNVITQVGLNLVLNAVNFYEGFLMFALWYIVLELLVCAVEAGLYVRYLSETGKGRAALYAAAANGLSFAAGLWLSMQIPGLF